MSLSSDPAPGLARSRIGPLRAVRALVRTERGQAVVEFALILPVVLVLVLGIVEFGNMFQTMYSLSSLSRESANVAARGSRLDQAVQLALDNGADMHLAAQGGVVASRLTIENGVPMVQEQVASSGYEGQSRIGLPGKPVVGLDQIAAVTDRPVYVVELFYHYQGITPLDRLATFTLSDPMYDRSIF